MSHLPSDPQPQNLDDHLILEPVEPGPSMASPLGDPVIRDVEGRLWRVRRRSWLTGLVGAWATVLVGLALVLLVLALQSLL